MHYIDEGLGSKNHPKLRKLTEVMQCFFNDDKHKGGSKVIIFTQYRDSANEIKQFLNNKIEPKGLVKCDVFLGQRGEVT